MKNLLIQIFLLLLSLQSVQFAQYGNEGSIIAWVGEEVITSKEFIELYELNPQINSINNSTSYFSKLKFLKTLIAYKLWNQHKNELGVSESLAYNTAKEEIKKLFVRDALYRKKIIEEATPSLKEIEEGVKKQRQNLIVGYLFIDNENEAHNLYKLLQQGFPFDTLLINSTESEKNISSFEVKFGYYNEYVENQLYELNVGDYTQPLELEDGYYIFHLKNIIRKLWSGDKKNEDDIDDVKKILSKRKEIKIYDNYMRSVLNGLQVNVDKYLFNKLSSELNFIYVNNIDNHKTEKEFFHLTNSEFVELENKFTKNELKSSFLTFPSDTITFKTYLRSFFFNGIKFPKSNLNNVTPILDSYIREFIIKEKLYQIGKAEKLDTLNEVKKYEKMWSEYYAFETAKGYMYDTVNVSKDEIEFEKNRNNLSKREEELIKLNYLCYQDSTSLNNMLAEKEKGVSFDSLKSKNELIIQNAFFSDSTSWVPMSICGKFRSDIYELNVGELLEPIKWDSLLVVLKLSDRRQSATDTTTISNNGIDDIIKARLTMKKIKEQIVNTTYEFASKTSIKINYEILHDLEVTKINSLTIRYMGFGGSITGVPIYSPNYEWFWMLNNKYRNLP